MPPTEKTSKIIMMKFIGTKISFFLLFLTFLSCGSIKPVDSTADSLSIKEEKLANALLWEIHTADQKNKSFLFGTIHIINDVDFFYPQGTQNALDQSEKVIFEVDMKDMMDMSKAMGMLQKAYMDDGLRLKDILEDDDYKLVEAHFQKMGLPLFFLERIKPMFLSIFASEEIRPEDLQSGKIKSYEMEFAKTAEQKGKMTGGLETIDFQISIFDKIPYKDQAAMLVESIKSSDTGSDQFKQMVDIYKKQDINAMQDMMKADETIETYEDVLLNQRNKNWIPVMKELMSESTTFFAVGAGHLGGEEGVINLLRKEGYILKPVIAI
jgi:uncharacterized protein YbaP (TraB family)